MGESMQAMHWFTASIPVPVKVQPMQGDDAVLELVEWG